jgi:hypothetical protein
MLLKTIIVVLLLAVVVSLFSGLVFLIKDNGDRRRVVNSLAVRVGLSIVLLAVLLLSLWQGGIVFNSTP